MRLDKFFTLDASFAFLIELILFFYIIREIMKKLKSSVRHKMTTVAEEIIG